MPDLYTRIREIDDCLETLPKGTLTYKTINGKSQPYLQRTVAGKSISIYIKKGNREQILADIEKRSNLLLEKERLLAYLERIRKILVNNPYLKEKVGIGYQRFEEIRDNNFFYVDKTHFISEWWNSSAQVSLITRPRRFGKTLLMSTVECFFSPLHSCHPEYFNKLSIWKNEEFRKMYGTIPIIFISFGGGKGGNFRSAMHSVIGVLYECYSKYHFLSESDHLSPEKKSKFLRILTLLSEEDSNDFEQTIRTAVTSIKWLCEFISLHYGQKPILLLDEYDTPLSEAYVSGYFSEMIDFCRQFFHESFKDNHYFFRAIITGITKISKNSLFSDLNNIATYTCTSNSFTDCFGFTQQEVMDALDCQDIHEMEQVKEMYDGFIFGNARDIYNPWSICCFMAEGNLASYWVDTSSNDLIGRLIRKNPISIKKDIEMLLTGESIHKSINENASLQYQSDDEEAFWALLLSAGYIKADQVKKRMEYTDCEISITNKETLSMFESQILKMFPLGKPACSEFTEALLQHRIEDLNVILNDLVFTSVSYFDTGSRPSVKAPENFYHGLVLGMIVLLKDRYLIKSNRESGYGRYDIAMIPKEKEMGDAFLIEFKIHDNRKNNSLEETAEQAIAQISDKCYIQELLDFGITEERVYKLGFAFCGKEVVVKEVV